jgi:hypothetical protein
MNIEQNIFIPFHQQDNDHFCGAACLQMVLTSLGTPVENLYQEQLFDEIIRKSSTDPAGTWYAAPDGMLQTITDRNPVPSLHSFLLYAANSEEQISRNIVFTISTFQIGPIALVFDMQHWCVISGYSLFREPTPEGDSVYIILGFWVKNPFPPTPIQIPPAPPPPHWAFDRCGWGNGEILSLGNPNLYVSYYTWRDTYMTPVRDGYWKGKYLAICDPTPASTNLTKKSILKNIFKGEKIIGENAAGECAMTGLQEHGLMKLKSMEKILEGSRPGKEIRLVHRLDRVNSLYYIVPVVKENNEICALTCVDALFGYFMQATFASEEVPIAYKFLSRDEILQILGSRLEYKCEDKLLIIHPEIVSIYPSLVWRPCKESLSPEIPFYMVIIQNERIYVRLDGEVFTSLTTDGRGL